MSSVEVRPSRPSGSFPLVIDAAGAAGVIHHITTPGNRRSHFITGILMGVGAADDGFTFLRRNCLSVTGATDTITLADTGTVLDLATAATGKISISFWIKHSTTTLATLFIRGTPGTDGYGVSIATGKIVFTIDDTAAAPVSITQTTASNDGKWHFITITCDRIGATGLNIYMDGVLDCTPVDASSVTGAVTGGTTLVTTGHASDTILLSTLGLYIDAAVLSAATILAQYNEGRGLKLTGNETNITIALNFDEGSGAVQFDLLAATTCAHANCIWVNDGVGILDDTTGKIGILETTADGSKSLSFPQAIAIGVGLPLAILETDGAWNATIFGYTDYMSE